MKGGSVRSLFHLLPAPLQAAARIVRRHIPLTLSERWIRSEYTPFAIDERKRVLLSTARFLHINRPVVGYYLELGSL